MSTTILILGDDESVPLRELAHVDIVIKGDVIIKDRHGNALRLLAEASIAKTLGKLIEEAKPEEPRYYGRLGK